MRPNYRELILTHLDRGAQEIGKSFDLANEAVATGNEEKFAGLHSALEQLSKEADKLCGDIMEGKYQAKVKLNAWGRPRTKAQQAAIDHQT